ncbi:hypothetical protein LCGC14_2119670, partial [marine sediment metagenome]
VVQRARELGLNARLETQGHSSLEELRQVAEQVQTTLDSPELREDGPVITLTTGPARRYVLMPHNDVLAPDAGLRIQALRLALESPLDGTTHVAEQTAEQIKARAGDLESVRSTVWQRAAGTIRDLLLHDFRYTSKALVRLEGLKWSESGEAINAVADGLFKSTPESIREELPEALRGPWRLPAIREQAVLAARQAVTKGQDMVSSYLDGAGLLLLGGDLSPHRLIILALLQSVRGDAGEPLAISDLLKEPAPQVRQLAGECVQTIWQEVLASQDPMVVQVGLGTVLALRPHLTDDWLAERDRRNQFNGLLLALLRDAADPADRPELKVTAASAALIHAQAKYWLRYLDDRGSAVFPEPERRVAVAWWLGRRYFRIAQGLTKAHEIPLPALPEYLDSQRQYAEHIEGELMLRTALSPIPKGMIRLQTLTRSNPIASATIAMLAPPGQDEDATEDAAGAMTAHRGLKEPSELLAVAVRDRIVDVGWNSAFLADGALLDAGGPDAEDVLPWCWLDPPCRSMPRLIRAYYGKHVDLLGRDRMLKIELAETFSRPGYLAEELSRLGERVKEEDPFVAYACQAVYNLAEAGYALHEEFRRQLDPVDINVIAGFAPPMSSMSLLGLAGTIKSLMVAGHRDDVGWLHGKLVGLNVKELSDGDLGEMVMVLANAAVLG